MKAAQGEMWRILHIQLRREKSDQAALEGCKLFTAICESGAHGTRGSKSLETGLQPRVTTGVDVMEGLMMQRHGRKRKMTWRDVV